MDCIDCKNWTVCYPYPNLNFTKRSLTFKIRNMKQFHHLAVFYVRLALGATMLSAVADRLGVWGAPGAPGVAWGNWENFVASTADINSFMPASTIPFLAVTATVLEFSLSILLITGFKTRIAAFATGCLLSAFALAMTLSSGIKAALDYSVFIGSAAGLMLATAPYYKYSIDELLKPSPNPTVDKQDYVKA